MKYLVITLALISLVSCKNESSKTNSLHQREDIDIMQAKDILDHQPEVIFLDVRTPEEIADGHIPGAAMADVKASNFEEEIKQLDPNKEYVVYCRSGRRSVKASKIMLEQGFTKVKNMKGGYNAWKEKYVE